MSRPLRMLAALLPILLAGAASADVQPYVADADTELLFSLEEPVGTLSSGLPDFFIVDDESANEWNLRTDPTGTSPFQGTPGPTGLGASARCDEAFGLARSINSDVTDLSLLEVGTFTIEAWVRNPVVAPASPDLMTIFQASNESFSTLDQFLYFQLQEGPGVDELQLRLVYRNTSGGVTQLFSDPFPAFTSDVWYHAAVTYDDNGAAATDDSTVRFYIDSELDEAEPGDRGGSLVGTSLTVEDVMAFDDQLNGDFFVGHATIGGRRSLGGELDEFRYSSVVRSTFHLATPAITVPSLAVPTLVVLGALLAGAGLLAALRLLRVKTEVG